MFNASLSAFQPISVSTGSKSYFWRIFDGFTRFLNANNSETVEASQLKRRLFRGSTRRYEPAKSELSRFNSKEVNLRTFDSRSKLWGGVGRPDLDRSMVLDEGSL
jgi:hypothetical protein